MKLSNELQAQLNNLTVSGSIYLNEILKRELSQAHEAMFGDAVNIQCGTCVLRAAHRLNMKRKAKPVLQKVEKIEPLKVEVKAVNEYETWTRRQLLDYATEKGIVFTKNIRTVALIKKIKSHA
jgi:hypothetical protein